MNRPRIVYGPIDWDGNRQCLVSSHAIPVSIKSEIELEEAEETLEIFDTEDQLH